MTDEELKVVSPMEIPPVDSQAETVSAHGETDDLSSSTEIKPSEILYKPSKSDILPLVIIIIGTILCLVGGLTAFFVVKQNEVVLAKADFPNAVGAKGAEALRAAIQSTKVSISDVTSLFAVTNGNINQFTQFIPFTNSTGTFPVNIARLYYAQRVPPGQTVDDFAASLKAINSSFYSSFTVTSRNSSNLPVPDRCENAEYCLPVTILGPISAQSLSLMGFNHYSDVTRIPVIRKAIDTKQVAATQQIVAASTSGPPLSGSVQYSPVFNVTGSFLGVISAAFQNSLLIFTASRVIGDLATVSVYDVNTTRRNESHVFNTDTWQGPTNPLKAWTFQQDQDQINRAPFVYNESFPFADRTWTAVFIPSDAYLAPYYNNFNKFIAIIVMVIIWLLIVALCVFLFFFGRLRTSMLAREASQRKILALGKFQPKDFLRLVRAVNQVQYQPGKYRQARITMMNVELGNMEATTKNLKIEEVMNLMNEFYEYVKGAAKQNDGFIHTCERYGFILLFTNEQKAYNAGVMIHRFPRSADLFIHVTLHSDKPIMGIVGDNESLHEAVLSDEFDTLRQMAADSRKHQRRITVSQPVLESVKKSCEKLALYLGIVPVNHRQINMYEILEDTDEKRMNTKENYGSAIECLMNHDYLAALTQIQTVIDVDPMDAHTRHVRDILHLKLKVCKTTASVWNVVDTLNEPEVLLPIFEKFMEQEKSSENMDMWKAILEFKSVSAFERRKIAAKIYEKYCVQMDMNLNQSTIETINNKIKSDVPIESDLFNFVLSELELLMSDTHNRFKNTRAFINGLCRVISESTL